MAYDRYVAISHPLRYAVVMSQRVCWVLVAVPYLYSASLSLITTIKIFISSFCGYNVIRHFYCDSLPLLALLCSSTLEIELFIQICSVFNLGSSLLIVLVSYILIPGELLRLRLVVSSFLGMELVFGLSAWSVLGLVQGPSWCHVHLSANCTSFLFCLLLATVYFLFCYLIAPTILPEQH